MYGLVCLQVLSKILSTKSSFNPKKPLYSSSLPTLRLPLTFSLKYLLGNVLALFCFFLFHIIVIRPSRRLSLFPRLFLPSDLLPIVSLLGLFFSSLLPRKSNVRKERVFSKEGGEGNTLEISLSKLPGEAAVRNDDALEPSKVLEKAKEATARARVESKQRGCFAKCH